MPLVVGDRAGAEDALVRSGFARRSQSELAHKHKRRGPRGAPNAGSVAREAVVGIAAGERYRRAADVDRRYVAGAFYRV